MLKALRNKIDKYRIDPNKKGLPHGNIARINTYLDILEPRLQEMIIDGRIILCMNEEIGNFLKAIKGEDSGNITETLYKNFGSIDVLKEEKKRPDIVLRIIESQIQKKEPELIRKYLALIFKLKAEKKKKEVEIEEFKKFIKE